MHKVSIQRSGELFVKNMLIFIFLYMIIIKKYKVKKFFNKFRKRLEYISGNFPREISEFTILYAQSPRHLDHLLS